MTILVPWSLASCSESHFKRSLLSALCFRTDNSSSRAYFPRAMAFRRVPPSMAFVKQSANIAWLLTHLSRQCSASLSLTSKHSNVVRNSSQTGGEVFVDMSKTDLQPVAMVVSGAPWRISDGFVQSMLGSHNQAHMIRSQLTRSNVLLKASALDVLRTRIFSTRPSYRTNHRELVDCWSWSHPW